VLQILLMVKELQKLTTSVKIVNEYPVFLNHMCNNNNKGHLAKGAIARLIMTFGTGYILLSYLPGGSTRREVGPWDAFWYFNFGVRGGHRGSERR